jgi:hypothetical protein
VDELGFDVAELGWRRSCDWWYLNRGANRLTRNWVPAVVAATTMLIISCNLVS